MYCSISHHIYFSLVRWCCVTNKQALGCVLHMVCECGCTHQHIGIQHHTHYCMFKICIRWTGGILYCAYSSMKIIHVKVAGPALHMFPHNEIWHVCLYEMESLKHKQRKCMISYSGHNKLALSGGDRSIKVILPFLHFYSFRSLLCFVSLSLWCCLWFKIFYISQHL